MKTKNLLPIIGCTLLVMLTGNSFSQTASDQKEFNHSYAVSLIANLNSPDLDTNASADASVTVNTKVQKSFDAYFAKASEQNWSMVGDNFLNRFHSNGVLTNALFGKKGTLIYTVTYGAEKDMPADIRHIVKSEYYDYNITMAIEVKENKRDIWVVKLDNATEQINVRVEDGEMERVQQFIKSN